MCLPSTVGRKVARLAAAGLGAPGLPPGGRELRGAGTSGPDSPCQVRVLRWGSEGASEVSSPEGAAEDEAGGRADLASSAFLL